MAQVDPTKLLIWKFGRPADLWLLHNELISSFISKNKLKPLEIDSYPAVPALAAADLAAVAPTTAVKTKSLALDIHRIPWPKPFPGGLRIPHLHFGPDIYLLDRARWKEFSSTVMRDVQARIANAKEISFEQAIELTEAANSLG